MTGGWIKLHRKIWENPYMDNPSYLAVWIWILTNCQHGRVMENGKWRDAREDELRQVRFSGKIIRLQPGQVTCGGFQIQKETGVPRATVQRIIQHLKNEHQIEQRTDHQCSLITVINWKEYQENEHGNEQRMSNDRATSEQRMSTNKEVKNDKKKKNESGDGAVAPTPAEQVRDFLTNEDSRETVIRKILASGWEDEELLRMEVKKFCAYWTERNKSGTKARWELEKTFELRKRLNTWIQNISKFSPHSYGR